MELYRALSYRGLGVTREHGVKEDVAIKGMLYRVWNYRGRNYKGMEFYRMQSNLRKYLTSLTS